MVLDKTTNQLANASRYEISTEGTIRIFGTNRLVKQYFDLTRSCQGSQCASVNGRYYRAAHLVLWSFVGPAPDGKPDAAHWNDDRRDNRLTNLRWASRAENLADRKFTRPEQFGGTVTKAEGLTFCVWDEDMRRMVWNHHP
jgi:hypothetical protein